MNGRARCGRITGAGAGTLAVLLALGGCSGGAKPAPHGAASAPGATASRPAVPSGPYVAIGDSYTAGLKVDPAGGGVRGCSRSAANYPSLVAADLHLAPGRFTDVSCSSATTADLTAAQQVAGGSNPPQLDALSAATGLVTIGIGGNDAGFMKVMEHCAEQGVAASLLRAVDPKGAKDAPCRDSYTAADGSDKLTGVIGTVGQNVAGVLGEVTRRAPHAKVYLVGYPALLPADPARCGSLLGGAVTAGDLAFLAAQEQRLNAELKNRAEAAGAVFVDTYTPSLGHDMCSGQSTRWIEPPFPAAGRAPLHPNAAGQQGMAAAVLRSVRGG
ncbi:SGNH/GDSL hydrolase family protein [Kitasatospora sp. NBC_01302]|uniref:SGNH/GDSL hydrolase family protein n=1 Tax=Kitasatospora sp. NBC_01302 TaxID=2903575 RepID=UPI002E12AAA1|nr:SGNH/GDSL hydrolase family protein [Kitasatospora sp. NBC_01302]